MVLDAFTLTASAADVNGDALTYNWEQYNLGTASPPNTDDGTRPIFRSFAITSSPARTAGSGSLRRRMRVTASATARTGPGP